MSGTLTFEQWVVSKADQISEARGVSVEDLATEPGELSKQLARVRQHFVAMGEVKADATSWVNKARAAAIQTVFKTHDEYSSQERKMIADADPTFLQALRMKEEVANTIAALKAMHFEILNDRRSSFNPKAHDNN